MRSKIKLATLAVAFVTAASLIAGTFGIEIGKPSANPEAMAKHAVIVVRGYSCKAPEKTAMTASAEGLVNGKRQSIPLKLISLSGENMFAVTRQWPAEGRWVLTIVESNPNFKIQPSIIAKVDGDSVDWSGITRLQRAPTSQELEAALNATVTAKLQKRQ